MDRKAGSVSVDLSGYSSRSYSIVFDALTKLPSALEASGLVPGDCLVVTDDNVAPLYATPLVNDLRASGWAPRVFIIPSGEASKCVSRLEELFDFALTEPISRNRPLIAVGGGVVGDLAGFAAAALLRGLPLVHVPTTLVAQVDSSIGGKTGINHPAGKNLIGAFHQPRLVFSDTSTLSTLPVREWQAGLAEVVKTALIRDENLFDFLRINWTKVVDRDPAAVAHVVRRSAEIKAEIVSEDELEHGVRAFLNFGHTFGHALETSSGYGMLLHGEAIAVGMRAALHVSGIVNAMDPSDALELVSRLEVPSFGPDVEIDGLIHSMQFDKKRREGYIRLVLLERIGSATILDRASEDLIRKGWEYALGTGH